MPESGTDIVLAGIFVIGFVIFSSYQWYRICYKNKAGEVLKEMDDFYKKIGMGIIPLSDLFLKAIITIFLVFSWSFFLYVLLGVLV